MQHRAGRSIFLLAVVLSMSAAAFGQATPPRRIQVSSTPTCPRCTVELVPVRALKDGIDTLGPTNMDVHRALVADQRGNVITVAEGENRLLVYDTTGRLLRTVGRRGQGPGEFELIHSVRIGAGDSVWVFDLRRTSVFDPGLTRFARSAPHRLGSEMVLLRDGGTLIFGNLARMGTTAGPPLHVWEPPATTIRSFGTLPALATSARSFPFAWLVPARAPVDAAWLAWRRRYQIELWDATGRQHLVMTRRIDWFPPWDDGRSPPGSPEGYGPTINGVHEDSKGRLWVTIQRTLESRMDPTDPRPVPTKWETVVEVLDPARGTLVMSSRTLGGYVHIRDDLVARYPETAEGYRYIELFRLVLTER